MDVVRGDLFVLTVKLKMLLICGFKKIVMNVKNLTVTVKYRVTISNVEIDDEIFNQLKESHDDNEILEPDMMEYLDAADWLSENIKEKDCWDWECKIDEIE